jgi:hypothetical protein
MIEKMAFGDPMGSGTLMPLSCSGACANNAPFCWGDPYWQSNHQAEQLATEKNKGG